MIKKYPSLMVICLLAFGANTGFITAQMKTNNNLSQVEKVKANVFKRGTGSKAKVNIKMQNGTKVKGFISQTSDDSFTLTDSETMQTTTLAYTDVAEVKRSGGLSTAAKIGIGIGVGVLATAIVISVAVANADFGVW